VVTVRAHRDPPVQVGRDGAQQVRVGQLPQPVPQPVAQRHVDEGRGPVRVTDGLARGAAAAVHEEDRLEVGLDRLVEREPVGDGPGHGALVRQHDAVLRRREGDGPEQAALDVRRGGRLVHVEGRLGVRPEDPGGPPRRKRGRGAPVPVTLGGLVPWEDEAYDVLVARLLERRDAGGVDDVVRRSGDSGQVDVVAVAQRTERAEDQLVRTGRSG
jgi:hypothetical protein